MADVDYRRFFVIVFELFIILKLYDWLNTTIGLSFEAFLVLGFAFFWLLNYFVSKVELGREVPDTILCKLFPQMRFSSEWTSIFIASSIVVGFFLSRLILGSAFLVYIIVFMLALVVAKLFSEKSAKEKSYTLLILAFMFGLIMGNKYSNHVVVIAVFVIGYVIMYLTSQPEARHGF